MNEPKKQRGHNLLKKTDKDLPGLKFKYLCDFLDKKKGRVLEIGSASGKNLRSIHNYNNDLELYGIDIDGDAIKEAQKNYSEFINFFHSRGESTGFGDGFFDYIIISDYLEHVEDSQIAINEIYRILKKGGYIHAFIPCEGEIGGIYWIFKKIFGFNVKKTGGHIQFFDKKGIKKAFSMRGFEIINEKYSYHILGQIMDFGLFALLLNEKIAKVRRETNKYYNEGEKTKSSIVSIIFNKILSFANYIAYMESQILQNIGFGATGIHLVLKKS